MLSLEKCHVSSNGRYLFISSRMAWLPKHRQVTDLYLQNVIFANLRDSKCCQVEEIKSCVLNGLLGRPLPA